MDGKAHIIYPVDAPEALREHAQRFPAESQNCIVRMKNQVAQAPEVQQ
jgi:hypothetical protein